MTTPDHLRKPARRVRNFSGRCGSFPSFRGSREITSFLAGAGREATPLGGETFRILSGQYNLAPTEADRRFSDAAWRDERTTRRAVAEAKARWRAGHRRTYRPWITEPLATRPQRPALRRALSQPSHKLGGRH